MSTRRPQTARELVAMAGGIPALVVAFGLLSLPGVAWAQPGDAKSRPAAQDDKSKSKVAVSEHMTVDLHLKDEDLSNVLELLSIQTQKNIVASKGVTGKVTATLYGVTFYQALDAILHVNGYGYIENGNFVYVYTNDELKGIQAALKKRVAKVIRLNYLNAEDAKEFLTPLLSKEGGELKVAPKTKDFAINEKAPTGKNDYALGDVMVVNDFEENVTAIEALVKQLDTRPQQVLVEATILQTSLNEANAFGVDFSIIGDVNFLDFINVGGPLGAANALIKGGTGAANSGVSPGDNQAHAITSTVGGTAGQGGFKVGVMAGDVGIFVRMLDSVTDTVILSNPKILALNRQPARVLVGKRVGYLNTTQTETSTTQSVQFLDTGTQLYFRPFVSDQGEVRMELKPQVSTAEIRTITDSGGRAVTIPDEVTQEMTTNVNVRDGQTVVLGGLFTESSTFTRNQVPWAGDLPILGAAFRGHDDSTVRSEIIFLITPSIVTDTFMAGAADLATSDLERVRAGMRQKLLPWSRERMTDKLNVEAEAMARQGDFAGAQYKLQRSLSLNSGQIEARRLNDKITGESEHWPNPSLLDSYLREEVIKRGATVPTSPNPLPHLKPDGSTVVPMDKIAPQKRSEGEPMHESMMKAESKAILMPGQQTAQTMFGQDAASDVVVSTATSPASTTTYATPAHANADNQAATSATPNSGESSTSPAPAVPAQNPGPIQSSSAEQHSAASPMELPVFEPAPATQPTASAALESAVSVIVPPSSQTASTMPTIENNLVAAKGTDFMMPAPNAGFNTPTAAASIKVAGVTKTGGYTAPELNEVERKAVSEVRQSLPGLRGQIELFGLMNAGQTPNLGCDDHDGWNDLFTAQLLMQAPANDYVGGQNATKVVIGENPDTQFHNNYGWIYNPKTGKLWAAGFDASDRPLMKTAPASTTVNATANNVEQPKSVEPSATTVGVETDGSKQ